MYARPFHPDLPLMAMRVSSFSRAKDELKMHRWECMVLLLDQICGMPALRARILPARFTRREGLAHSDGRVRTVALIYDSIKFRERRA